MIEKTVTVKNRAGIHCRPSSAILLAAMEFTDDHQVKISCQHGECALKSILELLALGLQQGDIVTIAVSGPRETELCEKLAELFAFEFDFPPRS